MPRENDAAVSVDDVTVSHFTVPTGDQVLEWNGITLTGKTFEEVQRTIAQPNGELELVVRP